ncbi:glycerophosphodiester phosphodiesterase [Geodermatophilus sp. SYSU D00703]
MTRPSSRGPATGALRGRAPVRASGEWLPRGDAGATVFDDGPVVIGHRGLGCGVVSGHRENTLASFTSAVTLGMGWVEADVRRTRDDVLVVEHDEVYPDGTRLADVPVDEADRRGSLRLAALLEHLPEGVGLDLDLKSCVEDSLREPDRTTAGLLGPVVAAEGDRRRVVVSSFDPAALTRLRTAAPRVALAWLTWRSFPLGAAVAGCAHMDVDVLGLHVGSLGGDPGSGAVDPTVVARAVEFVHGARRRLMVWCPAAAPARVLVEAGVDAVVVDGVPGALEVLGNRVRPARSRPAERSA